jgi:hypothetical protein
MGEEKEILLRGKVCAYLTCRLMGDALLSRKNHATLLLADADPSPKI